MLVTDGVWRGSASPTGFFSFKFVYGVVGKGYMMFGVKMYLYQLLGRLDECQVSVRVDIN